jgi:hypothetical protein
MAESESVRYRVPARSYPNDLAVARNLKEWIGSRNLLAPSTNAGTAPLPFQRWHRFKEAFSPEFVAKAVAECGRKVARLCDPCGGSGTTALTAQFLGIESVSIEVNPFLADLIHAKVSRYDVSELLETLTRVCAAARRMARSPRKMFEGLPRSFIEPGIKNRWLFDLPVAKEIAKLRTAIEAEANEEVRTLFTVILGGLLVELSNAVVSGKGRRYRSNWRSRRVKPGDVLSHFSDAIEHAIVEIDALGERPEVSTTVISGDAREDLKSVGPADLLVCSPPYPNSFDYTDVYNIELWMLGYLKSSDENQALRRSTITSHIQISRTFPKAPTSASLQRVVKRLRQVKSELWNDNLIGMVEAYFADLYRILEGAATILPRGGQAWIVVGDSQYAGVRIPVSQVLSEIAPAARLKPVLHEPFRSMRVSPQQGGMRRLGETLLVLAKS